MSSRKLQQDQKQTLEGLIRLFEDTLIRTTSNSVPIVDFDPVLVIDLRRNHFDAFVLSLRSDGTLHRLPRPVKIEEAESISAARDRTPLCAYRKQRASMWTACSMGRLQQLSTDAAYETVDNVFEYILRLPETEQNKTFERLWFAFLSLLSETDSGQDYKRILLLVDDERHQAIIQAALPRVGGRLDKGSGSKWQSATSTVLDHKTDISAYAFLSNPYEVDRNSASYLLIANPSTGHEYRYDGSEMKYIQLNGTVNFKAYDRILVLGMEDSSCDLDHIQVVEIDEFEKMCLNGYINWWLRIDDTRLEGLRAKRDQLQQEIEQMRKQNSHLQQLAERMSRAVNHLNGNRG